MGHDDGARSSAATFGALFCTNSRPRSALARPLYFFSAFFVSADVENEFISMKARSTPNASRMCSTCFAMKSRKVSLPFSGSRLFAFSSPIPVPSPPLSLSTTVDLSSVGSSAVSASYDGSVDTGEIDDSGSIRSAPDASFS